MNNVRSLLIFLLLIFLTPILAADPNPRTLIQLYKASDSLDYKLKTLKEIAQQEDDVYSDFFVDLVYKLATRFDREPYASQTCATEQLLLITLQQLRKYKREEGAQWVNFIRTRTRNSRIKREAILTLGELKARKFAPSLASDLKRYNQYGSGGTGDLESEALMTMLALEQLEYTEAFVELFRAWQGWYSQQVTGQALRVLKALHPDPSHWVSKLAEKSPLADLIALITIEMESEAALEAKQAVISQIFIREMKYSLRDKNLQSQLIAARIMTMDNLRMLGSDAAAEAPYCAEILTRSFDVSEKSAAIKLLGQGASESAIRVLSDYLRSFREKGEKGYKAEDHGLIKLSIRELAKTGSDQAIDAIISIQASNFPAAIVKEAKMSLESLVNARSE